MPLSIPTLISEGFGTGDSSKTYPIPVASQIGITDGAASFTDGFPPLTRTALDAGGIPPNGEDVNGILYMATAHLALVCSGQPYPYNSAQATAIGGYGIGALLARADGTGFWFNTTNGNTTNPDTGGAGWVPAFNYGAATQALSNANVTLTPAQYSKPLIVLSGSLTGNVNIVLPAFVQQWLVINNCTGAFTVTAVTAVGSTVGTQIPQGGPASATNIFGDGTGNIYTNAISTAGLAPKASPALTGTPTAPTAASTSNTTQIATTAFTQAAITAAIAGLAPLASPTFSGVPTAPTPTPATDNSTRIATTAFVQAVAGASISAVGSGYVNYSNGLQLRWGQVAQTAATTQSHSFAASFSTACFVVVACVANSTGVEFFSVQSQSASGWQQYSNNTCTVNYIAVGH